MVNCNDCEDTGWLGDNGPGVKGNNEVVRCDCEAKGEKCSVGCHSYVWYGDIPWCDECNLEADLTICRLHPVQYD